MDEVLRELVESNQCSELNDIVKAIEVVIEGEAYKIEVYRNFSLPGDRLLFEAHCFTQMVVEKTPGEFQFAWIYKSMPSQIYPDAERAVRGTVRELSQVTKAMKARKASQG